MRYLTICSMVFFAACVFLPAVVFSDPVKNVVESDNRSPAEMLRPRSGIPENRISVKFKEAIETQRKMAEMEKSVIDQDPELKQLAVQIQVLHKQLMEKLQSRLQDNQEYQGLKNKRIQMRGDLLKMNVPWKNPPASRP